MEAARRRGGARYAPLRNQRGGAVENYGQAQRDSWHERKNREVVVARDLESSSRVDDSRGSVVSSCVECGTVRSWVRYFTAYTHTESTALLYLEPRRERETTVLRYCK